MDRKPTFLFFFREDAIHHKYEKQTLCFHANHNNQPCFICRNVIELTFNQNLTASFQEGLIVTRNRISLSSFKSLSILIQEKHVTFQHF